MIWVPKNCLRYLANGEPDLMHLKQMIEEARKREEKGMLHPWQKENPKMHYPTSLQIASNIEIIVEHRKLINKANV